jgi:hypothetical protein
MSTKKIPVKSFDQNYNLSPEQSKALEILESGENVFLTGGAGSGKSHLIRAFTSDISSISASKRFPILASTGAAAVLIGGRTFHSFFGLGIMEGGPAAALKKATDDRRVMKRISEIEGFILDEVSMIPAVALQTAEWIARSARASSLPWGGLRVIVVGDFAQLPPVTRNLSSPAARDWAFKARAWQESGFQVQVLTHNHRVEDRDFLDILSEVRVGKVTERVRDFLNDQIRVHDPDDKATRLFPRRDQSENFNLSELKQINEPEVVIDSIYLGEARYVEALQKQAAIPNKLVLKLGCKVLFLQNDPQKRWVNGTRGTVVDIAPDKITVEKDGSKRDVSVDKTMFSLMDAEGQIRASVLNFPLTLAYATTIHKSQGATLDELWVDLSRLWEPGHAYVALSRLKNPKGLRVLGWSPRSFIVDPIVNQFYENLIN